MMSGDQTFPGFSDAELGSFLEGSGTSAEAESPQPSLQARRLARRLAAQYVESLTHLASPSYATRWTKSLPQVRIVSSSLKRLAYEMGDAEMAQCQTELDLLATRTEQEPDTATQGVASRQLREWILNFSELLEAEEKEPLRRLILLKRGGDPLITHIRGVRGIGRVRLEKLYLAGLLSARALAESDPAELAEILGSLPVAERVIEESKSFERRQRDEHVRSLNRAANSVLSLLPALDQDECESMLAGIRESTQALAELVLKLEGTWKTKFDR